MDDNAVVTSLFGLIKSVPREIKYENSLIMAEGDMLMLHGRFSGLGLPANWIVVDIVRMENGLLAEHWDVIEDQVTREKSTSGLPMFGRRFPPDDLGSGNSARRVVRGASGLAEQ
jgi:predicted SnoaL-like aldol condensation-catalyzing enzyme